MLTHRVRTILDEVYGRPAVLGGEEAGKSAAEILSARLWAANRAANNWQIAAAVMIIVLFVATLLGLSTGTNTSVGSGTVGAASGVTLSGLVYMMLRNPRQMQESGLLAALAERLPDEDVRDVMFALLRSKEPSARKSAPDK